MINVYHLIFAFVIACTAVVYACVITEPGELLAFWKKFLDEKLNAQKRACLGLGPHPVFKVLVGCEKCISGQMAFWIFLAYNYHGYMLITIIPHLLFTGFTIFCAIAAKKILDVLTN